MKSVVLSNVFKSYNSLHALRDISFSIDSGEIFGILGPDGAGKTTLFRIMATLLIPDSGTANFSNFDTVKDYKKIRKIIGYMPGRFSLYLDLTVEENISFYATVFNTSFKKNYDLIRYIYIHLEPFKRRLAGRLSGGMKQKLALCCALIHRPEILLLDEPTTGVDAVSRKEFWELLHDIKKEGITIIVSTPYMDEAGKCDRVSLLQNGSIMITGTPADIPAIMKKPVYSITSGDSVYDSLKVLRSYSWCHSAILFGREIHLALNNNTDKENFERDMGRTEFAYTAIKPGIEDVFMDLMTIDE